MCMNVQVVYDTTKINRKNKQNKTNVLFLLARKLVGLEGFLEEKERR